MTALYIFTGCGGSGNSTPPGDIKSKALPIPELLQATDKAGIKHYDLHVQKSKHDFFTDVQTDTFAINSTYLGPTLLMQNGDQVSINYTNDLDETVAMHGHGMYGWHCPSAHNRCGNLVSALYCKSKSMYKLVSSAYYG